MRVSKDHDSVHQIVTANPIAPIARRAATAARADPPAFAPNHGTRNQDREDDRQDLHANSSPSRPFRFATETPLAILVEQVRGATNCYTADEPLAISNTVQSARNERMPPSTPIT